MGIDTGLAIGEFDDEFVCSICTDIVQNPVVIPACDHYFCDSCIRPWVQSNSNCPIDRDPVEEAALTRPCRYFRNKLARVHFRCEFTGCDSETAYEVFEVHKNSCRYNPDALMECNFCHVYHKIIEEDAHKKSCIPFLHDTIAKNELEKNKLKREHKEELERVVKKARTSRYILSWNAKFPTTTNHQYKDGFYYCTWNHYTGNLVGGAAVKTKPKFMLDHGAMEVGLTLDRTGKHMNERGIVINFYLTPAKKGPKIKSARVKYKVVQIQLSNTVVKYSCSLISDQGSKCQGKVLWQKERIAHLDVCWKSITQSYDLPSDLPSKLLVVVQIIEWEPKCE